jgi:hypothetical protein
MTGNMGSISTLMFYDDAHDTFVVINFGSATHQQKSIKDLISIVQTLMRIK